MPSLVPDFLINPVLRQARRLSNFAAAEPNVDTRPGNTNPLIGEDEAVGETKKQVAQQDGSLSGNIARRLSSPVEGSSASSGSEPMPILARHTLPSHFRAPSLSQLQQQQQQQQQQSSANVGTSSISGSAPHRQTHLSSVLTEDVVRGNLGNNAMAEGGSLEEGIHAPPDMPAAMPASLPAGFYGNVELPEDDGMSTLRRRILDVQARAIAPAEKAVMMHGLLMEGYEHVHRSKLPARPLTPSSPAVAAATIREPPAHLGPLETLKFWHATHSFTHVPVTHTFALTEEDLRRTYVPGMEMSRTDQGSSKEASDDSDLVLGCAHYRRNVKMQCFTCERWYTCRLCHDEVEDHMLPRRDTKNMLCMLCGHAQPAGDTCEKCGEPAAFYYCHICKLWDGDPDKSIYHCGDCGICRVGEGLGKDFFHCKKCGSCIAINMETSHRCREGVLDCDCPICGEYMFTSNKKVVTMKCGHTIHDDCRAEYIKRSYKCPICSKSVENMESMFRRLDKNLEEQPMPEEYKDTRAVILCNDCEAKTSTKYHWGGLRCEICLSYNTVELLLLNSPKSHDQPTEEQARVRSAVAADSATQAGLPLTVATDHDSLVPPASSLPSPPLSSSPRGVDSPSQFTPVTLFRTASPRYMTSPTTAPVMATPPPGYSAEGFEADDDSDLERTDILGLWSSDGPGFLSALSKSMSDGDDYGDDDESESDDSEESEEDEDDEDEEEEEEIVLIGHR